MRIVRFIVIRYLLVFIIFSITHLLPHPALSCELIQESVISKSVSVYYSASDNIDVTVDLRTLPLVSQARRQIRQRTNPDPLLLLQRQFNFFRGFGEAYSHNFLLLINRDLDQISESRCLELRLLEEQLHRHKDYIENPTEFSAMVLRKKFHNHVMIVFQSSDGASISSNEDMERVLLTSIANGWVFWAHLHNHPFFFKNPSGDIGGTTIPSGTVGSSSGDLAVYKQWVREFGAKEFWITNGFSTLRISASDLPLFR